LNSAFKYTCTRGTSGQSCGSSECCIILHNLILQIEARNIDRAWQEELYKFWNSVEGDDLRRRQEELYDMESDDETKLGHAHCQAMSDGQKFRHKVMCNLFNSPTSGAVCRT
jgi:hypothetical protein